jgi:hypothetical protein
MEPLWGSRTQYEGGSINKFSELVVGLGLDKGLWRGWLPGLDRDKDAQCVTRETNQTKKPKAKSSHALLISKKL